MINLKRILIFNMFLVHRILKKLSLKFKNANTKKLIGLDYRFILKTVFKHDKTRK